MTTAEYFRTQVKRVCEEKGISQDSVARDAGMHYVSLSRILNGHTIPNINTCAEIAGAIHEPLSSLLPSHEEILSSNA